MGSASAFNSLTSRFLPYIEELHAFLTPCGVPFGTPADVLPFAEALFFPGYLRDGMSSMIRAIIYREQEGVSHLDLLEIVLVAVGGTELDEDAPGLDDAKRKLSRFIGQAMTSLWSMSPNTSSPSQDFEAIPAELAHEAPKPTDRVGEPATISGALYEAARISANHSQTASEPGFVETAVVAERPEPTVAPAVIDPPLQPPLPPVTAQRSEPGPVRELEPALPPLESKPKPARFRTPDWLSEPATAAIQATRRSHTARRYFAPVLVCTGAIGALLLAPLLDRLHSAQVQPAPEHRVKPLQEPVAIPSLPPLTPLDLGTDPGPDSSSTTSLSAAARTDRPVNPSSAHTFKAAHRFPRHTAHSVLPPAAQPTSTPAAQAYTGRTVKDLPSEDRTLPGSSADASAPADAATPFAAPARAAHGPSASVEPLSISPRIMGDHLVSAPEPRYPRLAKFTGVEGQVILQAVIAGDGSVLEARVISGPRSLRGAAEQALRHWRYQPYLLNGKPAEVATIVTLNFHLPH